MKKRDIVINIIMFIVLNIVIKCVLWFLLWLIFDTLNISHKVVDYICEAIALIVTITVLIPFFIKKRKVNVKTLKTSLRITVIIILIINIVTSAFYIIHNEYLYKEIKQEKEDIQIKAEKVDLSGYSVKEKKQKKIELEKRIQEIDNTFNKIKSRKDLIYIEKGLFILRKLIYCFMYYLIGLYLIKKYSSKEGI